MLDLKDVPVFVEVVECGGFSAAALRLHLTRSAVAKTIARLEKGLTVRLFHRTTRSQSLTEEGRLLYERCRQALDLMREAEAALDHGRQEVRGRLRVTAPVIFGRRRIAPLLSKLMHGHPQLEVEISLSDRVADLREEGFDLAIRNGSLKGDMGLTTRRIAYQTMVVCAAPDYLDARGAPADIDALSAHQAILYHRHGWTRDWIFPQPDGTQRSIVPPARLRLDDMEAMLDAAVAGFGLAWLPNWLVDEAVVDGRLRILLADLPSFAFQSHAVWLSTPAMAPRLRLAIDALVSGLRHYGQTPAAMAR